MAGIFKKKAGRIVLLLLTVFVGIQFIRPSIHNSAATQSLNLPPEVEAIIRTSCYDCHSNQTRLKWFDEMAPAYWLVASHVKEGRAALNFSDWDKFAPGDQKAQLYYSLNKILQQEMPLPGYSMLHPGTKPDSIQIGILKKYLLGLANKKPADTALLNAARIQYDHLIQFGNAAANSMKPAPNGIEYIPGYRNWKAISTTDRFDNGTMRVIFGNDIAVKAIKEKATSPWPDGTVFAKVAWAQLRDSLGNIRTGEFKQVEFMIKDSKKYAATEGWGWGRWKGTDLKPYGKNKMFTLECTSCHQPMKNYDFVFTLPLNLNTEQ